MANEKELQNRIKSVKDTMKITKAMYMMSSMKLRKAKQRLENTEPFFRELNKEITAVLYHFPDMQHIYFDNRPEDESKADRKVGYVIITGDKGMAGAYNHNVIKVAEDRISGNPDIRLFVVGEVGRHAFQGRRLEEDFHFSATNATMHRARVMTEYIMDLYNSEELDDVYVVYTEMINSMVSETKVKHLLPLKPYKFINKDKLDEYDQIDYNVAKDEADDWYLIYPSPGRVLEKLVYNYVTGFIYGALVECYASEENARMMAMQSATDNAEGILHELSMEYNRIRQASITQEITEVIGGAKALKKKKKKKLSAR